MRGEKAYAAFARGLAHLAPQTHGGLRVVAGACGQFQSDQVGIAFVVAAELEAEQLPAQACSGIADIAQTQQLRAQRYAYAGGLVLGQLLARMLAQGMGHLVAHDHGDLVVRELELVDDACVEGDLAAGHAERVDLLAAYEIDLPAPLAGARVPLRGIGNQALGNAAQALQLRVAGVCQRALGLGLLQQLLVLLGRRVFQRLGRHQLAHHRCLADLHLRLRWRVHQRSTDQCGQQAVAGGGQAQG